MISPLLGVALGGCVGCMLRYGVASLLARLGFMHVNLYSTVMVNLIGCFLIGIVFYCFESRFITQDYLRACLITGLLGGLTTFSALGLETFDLIRRHAYLLAIFNCMMQMILGVVLVSLGYYFAKLLLLKLL